MAFMRFAKKHVVLCVSAACAIATMFVVPPDEGYCSYIDWDTIGCLFCVLAVANAFRRFGVFDHVARVLLERLYSPRNVVAMLVATTGALSMFITNDMALIVMLPVAATALSRAGCSRLIPHAFVLQGLSANLCGMIMPFGNPQNLFLYSYFSLGLGDFLAALMPFFLASVALLAGGTWFLTRGTNVVGANVVSPSVGMPGTAGCNGIAPACGLQENPRDELCGASNRESLGRLGVNCCEDELAAAANTGMPFCKSRTRASWNRLAIYVAMLALSLMAVFRVVPVFVAVIVVGCALLLADRNALKAVDYPLLATFVCFFVFAGNIGRMPQLDAWLASAVQGSELFVSAALSQVISNVPAAVLLSHFTSDWAGVLVGVNIGGAGTLVGSLANLITLQYFMRIEELVPGVGDGDGGPHDGCDDLRDGKGETIGAKGEGAGGGANVAEKLSVGYFMKVFTLANVLFLAVLLAQGALLGLW